MKHEPISYRKPDGESFGCFYATMTPDGWTNTYYQQEMGRQMDPEWIHEFTMLVNDFIKRIKTLADLEEFAVKAGKKLKAGIQPVYGILFEENYMYYVLTVDGCNCEFVPYRKENA